MDKTLKMVLMVGLLYVLALGGVGYGYTRIINEPPALEDNFEDGVIDTAKWYTWTAGDNNSMVSEIDGKAVCSVTVPSAGPYYQARFVSEQAFDFYAGKTEFSLSQYISNTVLYFPSIINMFTNGAQTGFQVELYRYLPRVVLYEVHNGSRTALYDTGNLTVPEYISSACFSLVLDGSNYEFYWVDHRLGVTLDNLTSSGTHGVSPSEIGEGLKLDFGITNLGYFYGATFATGTDDAVVVQHSLYLEGTVVPGDFLGDLVDVGLTVELLQNDVVQRVERPFLDTNGKFRISSIAEGTYDVSIKGNGFLKQVVSGVLIEGPTFLPTVELVSGDCDGTGSTITSADLAIVLAGMDKVGQ
ncbi:MAG: hypothetical protein WC975_13930 [Phycisphaerae bacterium]